MFRLQTLMRRLLVKEDEVENKGTNLALQKLQMQSDVEQEDMDQRDQLFHTKCFVKDRCCSVVINGGSCTNVASSEMVSKLGLTTIKHPKPYVLRWFDGGKHMEVTKQVRVALAMGVYKDEVLCDVVPTDTCHILLGRPWLFDRDVLHRGRSNEYELRHNGKKIVLTPMPSADVKAMSSKRDSKISLTMLASEGKVEQILDQEDGVKMLVAKEDSKMGQISKEEGVAELEDQTKGLNSASCLEITNMCMQDNKGLLMTSKERVFDVPKLVIPNLIFFQPFKITHIASSEIQLHKVKSRGKAHVHCLNYTRVIDGKMKKLWAEFAIMHLNKEEEEHDTFRMLESNPKRGHVILLSGHIHRVRDFKVAWNLFSTKEKTVALAICEIGLDGRRMGTISVSNTKRKDFAWDGRVKGVRLKNREHELAFGSKLEHTIMNSLNHDAILTFLLNECLNRFKQHKWLLYNPQNNTSEVGAIAERNDEDRLKKSNTRAEIGKERSGVIKDGLGQVVFITTTHPLKSLHSNMDKGTEIKRMAWIEEGETCMLAEEGGLVVKVHGLNNPLELRTIPFQGGENDTNWDGQNSENGDEMKLATRDAVVERDKGRNGCEGAWKVELWPNLFAW